MPFKRGYEPVREKLSKGSKFTMSCFNCDSFYQAMGDTEELCQNPNVTQYDMVVSPERIYCTQWKPPTRKPTTQAGGIFLNKGVVTSGQKKSILKTRKSSSEKPKC